MLFFSICNCTWGTQKILTATNMHPSHDNHDGSYSVLGRRRRRTWLPRCQKVCLKSLREYSNQKDMSRFYQSTESWMTEPLAHSADHHATYLWSEPVWITMVLYIFWNLQFLSQWFSSKCVDCCQVLCFPVTWFFLLRKLFLLRKGPTIQIHVILLYIADIYIYALLVITW